MLFSVFGISLSGDASLHVDDDVVTTSSVFFMLSLVFNDVDDDDFVFNFDVTHFSASVLSAAFCADETSFSSSKIRFKD